MPAAGPNPWPGPAKPPPPRFILSDNGSEFLGHFQQRLEERGITHWWTYPRSPKMNAHAERFNRTLQEPFVDYHEDFLFDDLTAFNQKLADWLLAYNTVLPHHSLDRPSPVQPDSTPTRVPKVVAPYRRHVQKPVPTPCCLVAYRWTTITGSANLFTV